jgi:septal ring factor EnvC (AmiA/AmiB activator)
MDRTYRNLIDLAEVKLANQAQEIEVLKAKLQEAYKDIDTLAQVLEDETAISSNLRGSIQALQKELGKERDFIKTIEEKLKALTPAGPDFFVNLGSNLSQSTTYMRVRCSDYVFCVDTEVYNSIRSKHILRDQCIAQWVSHLKAELDKALGIAGEGEVKGGQ